MAKENIRTKEYEEIIKLIEKKDYAEAEEILTNLLIKKKDFYIHQLLRIIYSNKKDNKKAIDHFNLSLNLNSKNPGVLFNLAKVYEQELKMHDANKYYLEALSLTKDTQLIKSYSKFLFKIGEVSRGMSFQYQYFGNIRFGKTNLKIN